MDTHSLEHARQVMRKELEEHAFVRAADATIVSRRGWTKETGWLFDVRNILLKASVIDAMSLLFWHHFKDVGPIQLSGIETAAIPIVASLVATAHEHGHKDVSGVYIRKSRKREALTKMVEGTLIPGRPVVIVDDLTNSGSSLMRQVEVIEGLGCKVIGAWTVLRFRDADYYQYFREKKIPLVSLFELNDFTAKLETTNLIPQDRPRLTNDYSVQWRFASPNPSYQYVVPKSNPLIDDERLYVGSDNGTMWALDQDDGAVLWSRVIGNHPKGKGIFSSPALYDGMLYFGGYDGNVYALDAETGAQRWLSFEADWVGSSPAIAPDLKTLFIGLEFGLWRKRGGIVALDIESGKTKWIFREMPCLTHSSPLYIQEHQEVAIGSNDGCVYLFDALSGALKWTYCPGILSEEEFNSGFSSIDIKESLAYDAKRDLLIVANKAGSVFFIDRAQGGLVHEFKAEFGFYSTPVIFERSVLVASLDKNLYCIDLDSFKERWRWYASARIFSTPVIIENSVFIGSNTGRMVELDPKTGSERSSLLLTERITNKIRYNPKTKRFFVPTFANEIYCVERKEERSK